VHTRALPLRQAPACAVDQALLAQRDVFKSGCPGSLMESYVRCGAAISKQACSDAGPSCMWFDDLEERTPAPGPARRRLVEALAGAVPDSAPRACMPKQMYALEKSNDRAGVKKVLKSIATQDPAGESGWGREGRRWGQRHRQAQEQQRCQGHRRHPMKQQSSGAWARDCDSRKPSRL
jgi:hypothetical protein